MCIHACINRYVYAGVCDRVLELWCVAVDVQQVGGNWDGYWLTESILHDGDGLSSGVAY